MYFKFFLLCGLLFMASCTRDKEAAKSAGSEETAEGTYFSMREFVKDQWEMNKGIPYTLLKVVTEEGKTDSAWVSGSEVGLGDIMLKFIKTDIGMEEFTGKYNFSVVDDETSNTRTFYYEANSPKLYTRSLQVNVQPHSGRIKYIFVEAVETGSRKNIKLYYSPQRIIQIQESGKEGSIKTEYFFPGAQ